MTRLRTAGATIAAALVVSTGLAQAPPERARDLGIPLEGVPGQARCVGDRTHGWHCGRRVRRSVPGLFDGEARSGRQAGVISVPMLDDERIDPLYESTVQATEEAIINALLAAKTMTGADYLRVPALPHDRLREVLRQYGRLGR